MLHVKSIAMQFILLLAHASFLGCMKLLCDSPGTSICYVVELSAHLILIPRLLEYYQRWIGEIAR